MFDENWGILDVTDSQTHAAKVTLTQMLVCLLHRAFDTERICFDVTVTCNYKTVYTVIISNFKTDCLFWDISELYISLQLVAINLDR